MSSVESPRSLEHPLPAGMRDLLPDEAAARRALAGRVLECLSLHGYAVVIPPVFEFADVLERGLGTLDPTDVLRFVEPESGEVAALRPDMTPQIARIIATRLRDRPTPFRLAYEGTVLRRRSGRARKHRQIPQVGVELAGVAGPDGDLELIALAAGALWASGLSRFTIDIGDSGVVRALLSPVAPEHQRWISDALANKDPSGIASACRAARAPHADALSALPGMNGSRDALVEGVARLSTTPAAVPARRLLALFDAVRQSIGKVARAINGRATATFSGGGAAEPCVEVTGDLGEVRGFAYYTGTVFHAYAAGTGDAVGSGGRYDELLGRFGWDLPAAGFALDLDRVSEALSAARVVGRKTSRVVVVGARDDGRLNELRAKGIAAVAISERGGALAWARAWGFTHLFDDSEWVDVSSGASISSPLEGLEALEEGLKE